MEEYNQLRQLGGGNPGVVTNLLLQFSPKFQEYYKNNYGKSMEQTAQDTGIDVTSWKGMF